MTIKDLRTNDIILQRAGHVGMYIEKEGAGYIMYQSGGYDDVECTFNEDLTDAVDGENFDIMQVYRHKNVFIYFDDYKEADLIYVRDESWVMPE